MANRVYIVRNTNGKACSNCTGVHEFLTMLTNDAPCDTPAGFSQEVARNMAKLHCKNGHADVEQAKDDMLVVLHDSARKLPRGGQAQLAQFTLIEL